MLKSIFTVALSLILAATPALARDDSWYIGAEAGGTIISNADIDVTNSAGVFANNAYSINTEPGFDVGGILGYDFGWFRLEADVSYRRAEVTTIEQNLGSILPIAGTVTGTSVNYNPGGPNGNPPGNPFQWNGAQGSMRILAFMANGLLDFGDDDGFQGYIGGGVGIARTSFDGIRVTDAAPVITDDSDSGFAWQLVAGVRYPLSRNFDIGVKYRFFNQDDVGTNSFYSTSDETDVRSHSALVTLTYNFGSGPDCAPPREIIDGVCRMPDPQPVCGDGTPVPAGQDAAAFCVLPCPSPPYIPNTTYPRGGNPAELCREPPVVCDTTTSVIFGWDRDVFSTEDGRLTQSDEDSLQTLRQIVARHVEFGNGSCYVTIMLEGHTDTSGPPDYNDDLSARRAETVRNILTAGGIPGASISVSSFGEDRPAVDTGDGVREPANRRVMIIYNRN
ncbi:OmpA family protein [Parasphingopyxis lamellibrachiae]|uniref:Outer membrane protein OmpA-like peptidoglycan-associated protein n=1 Tax=Parasphingopyxis lamellibrachiae TaxID=680125 RepID=A0A3D9FEP1_9SPHN|nr:OmpA family protein [Parasphingopyxis lamellibrachiae]RED16032.1 outer membrane protein OmpA-like peptidoglycan-associated protein [Parasphingopyxis lamellibrachiae]